MGARGYIIKENEDGSFTAVYGHWLADRLYELARDGKATKEELAKNLNEWFKEYMEQEKRNGDGALICKLENMEEVKEFINFRDICIEAYAILFRNGKIIVFLTAIANPYYGVFGGVRIEDFSHGYRLYHAFQEVKKLQRIIDIYEALEKSEEEARQEISRAYRRLKLQNRLDCDVIIADNLKKAIENYETAPLRDIAGVLYF
ncbi:MAG: hypothetical protein DRP16_02730 [Candidatus Aenigmatarchaeota archaeon]|nr:MAG: hypothetical protein DRP16_02730 [Candidatus Aenigmarchaeota archaeon]HDI02635.1 hypothetical protein [Candidatus Aenigmarchaeota archaeon]